MPFTNQYLIDYFKQRMVELFDHNTLDSYRVRTCNTISILFELKILIEGWLIGNVKRGETVGLCAEEAIMHLRNDEWIDYSFFDKEKFLDKIEAYQRNVSKIKDNKDKTERDIQDANCTLRLVSTFIEKNDQIYLQKLVSAIEEDLFNATIYSDNDFVPVIESLDIKLSKMATELIRRGYSDRSLYFYFRSVKTNANGISFQDAFDQIKNKLCTVNPHKYTVIVRLESNKTIPHVDHLENEVPAQYIDQLGDAFKGFLKRHERKRFFVTNVKAADMYSALNNARTQLSQILDRNIMGNIQISNQAIVTYKKGRSFINNSISYYYDNDNNQSSSNQLTIIMKQIDDSTVISQEIKDRLNTALRHLRVGDSQTEIEQRFLNYWIGLEFIFATPKSGDSTYSRMVTMFPQIKTLYYLKRNIEDLDLRLKERGLLDNQSFASLSDNEIDDAFNQTQDILLKYRIKCMKSNLHHRDKIEKYLKRHIKNLTWHLSRIYYLRNELVHEAAIKQRMDSITNNLRSYLVFMLNLLLDYCKQNYRRRNSNNVVVMDAFFWSNQILWEKCTPEYKKEEILSISMPEKIVI